MGEWSVVWPHEVGSLCAGAGEPHLFTGYLCSSAEVH